MIDRNVKLPRISASFVRAIKRFVRFGLVGASGVVVDMGVFVLLSDRHLVGWDLSLSKIISAETAIINNFIWNDIWTFRDISPNAANWRTQTARFGKFNLICLAGIGLSVLLLNCQVRLFHLNAYAANSMAIFLVSFWNFWMNLKFAWSKQT